MTMLSTGITKHAERLLNAAGVTVTYSRGQSSVELLAVVDNLAEPVVGIEGEQQVAASERDFIFRWDDLTFSTARIEPTRGDRITFGSSLFEVGYIGGERPYVSCDAIDHMVRVHSKKIR